MSEIEKLKKYLIANKDSFLLNPDNNGKTIMLSGAWGAGKTYFWKEVITNKLSVKLSKKKLANVYVSLYGKESILEIKSDIYTQVYQEQIGDDTISKLASKMKLITPFLGAKELNQYFEKANKAAKDEKAADYLKEGSVICLDDFERKSQKIDLNDLFGFISQLAIELKCKIVIILNSEVFEDKDAKVFREVKEKTVNKFLYFNPTIDELFKIIFNSNKKYKTLENDKNTILRTIKESQELNARIYLQILDNCLEWVKHNKLQNNQYGSNELRTITLQTIYYQKTHHVLSYPNRENRHDYPIYPDNEFQPNIPEVLHLGIKKFTESTYDDLFTHLDKFLSREYTAHDNKPERSDIELNEIKTYIKTHQSFLKNVYLFGYELHLDENLTLEKYTEIYNFIKTGII